MRLDDDGGIISSIFGHSEGNQLFQNVKTVDAMELSLETKSPRSDVLKMIKNLDVSIPSACKDAKKDNIADKGEGVDKEVFHKIPTIKPTRLSQGSERKCAFCGKQFSYEYSLQTHEKFLCKGKLGV